MELLARTCKTETMNTQRIFARIFVVIVAVMWAAMPWGYSWAYRGDSLGRTAVVLLVSLLPLVLLFVLGLFYEQLAALLLLVGAVATITWGLVTGWSGGVWTIMLLFYVLPMVVAAVLYMLAARMQRICKLRDSGSSVRGARAARLS